MAAKCVVRLIEQIEESLSETGIIYFVAQIFVMLDRKVTRYFLISD
jgi:hypothetical protein